MKYWIIPCNVKTYDAIGAFNELKLIDWKQSKNLKSAKINDIVMIYLSKPFSCVKYICKIKKVNMTKEIIDDKKFVINGDNYTNYGNYMRIEFIKEIEENLITLNELHNHGMKGNVQGPRLLRNELLDFVLEVLEKTSNLNESQIENVEYKEGKILKKYGSKFERNSKLREKAIEIHGVTCKVCGFNFEKKYGNIGKNFIEIHHIKPMYDIRKEILVNPQTDLIPLCSNCHKMIHRSKRKPYTIAQLKSMIKFE